MPVSFTPRKQTDLPHALFLIAREHYVGARVSFVSGALFTAQVAMQQCIEIAAKAMLKLSDPNRKFGGQAGHRICDLLGELAQKSEPIAKLLTARDTSRVIKELDAGYNQIRYGEGILGVELSGTLRAFDVIAGSLLTEARRMLGYRELSVSVRVQAMPVFLWRLNLPVLATEYYTPGSEVEPWTTADIVLGSTPYD